MSTAESANIGALFVESDTFTFNDDGSVNPPSHLSEESQEWWLAIQLEHNLTTEGMFMLTLACEERDISKRARSGYDQEGLVNNVGRPHPLLKVSGDARRRCADLLKDALKLKVPVGRPGNSSAPRSSPKVVK